MEKMLTYILENHCGKVIGLVLGLIAGILVINYGFWKALFIALCIIGGFFIGKAIDENIDVDNWFKRFRER